MNMIKKIIIVLSIACLIQSAEAKSVIKKMYIDGTLASQVTIDGNTLTFPSARLTLASEGTRNYMYNQFVGKMDDFAIYNGVLSEARVGAHYSARTNYSSYSAAVTADAPKLWFKFDDSSTANNASVLNSGTVTTKNGTYIATSGTINKLSSGFVAGSGAIEFAGPRGSGGSGTCIDVYDDKGDFSDSTNGDISIEVWVNYTDVTDYPRFFQHNGSWNNTGSYGISVNDPNQVIMMGGNVNNYVSYPTDLSDGAWHHIVVTYDSTADPLPTTGSYVSEISSDNPVVWLRFEDSQAVDSAVGGSNHWVSYGSAATIVSGVGGIGKSVLLSGASGSGVYGVAVSNVQSGPPAVNGTYSVTGDQYAFAPGNISVEMWYKTLSTDQAQPSDYAPFFTQAAAEPCAPAISNAAGQLRLFGGSASYTGVDPKFDQKWHHLVVTYNEQSSTSMEAKLYIDGGLKYTGTYTGSTARLGPELSHLLIGANNNIGYTWSPFAGYVDEFAIYSGVLSSSRVLAHFAAWQPKTCAEMGERGATIAADFNKDCKVNFADFAELALNWMKCNKPVTTGCAANW